MDTTDRATTAEVRGGDPKPLRALLQPRLPGNTANHDLPHCRICKQPLAVREHEIRRPHPETGELVVVQTLRMHYAPCGCWQKQEAARLEAAAAAERQQAALAIWRDAGVHDVEEFERMRFEQYQLAPGLQVAFDLCREFVAGWERWRQEGKAPMLAGGHGTGKTHLAIACAHALSERPIPVPFVYLVARSYLNRLRAGYHDGTAEAAERRAVEVDLLLLDDLGAERTGDSTDWEREQWFGLFNARLLAHRPTMVTHNLSGRELEAYLGYRTYTRLREMSVPAALTGEDYRKRRWGRRPLPAQPQPSRCAP